MVSKKLYSWDRLLYSLVQSGVPQGTVLGPLLFLIYISDIGEGIKSKKNIYVDDTKIKSTIRTESDVEKLQEDIDSLQTWAEVNNMQFNGNKFQLVRFGNNEEIKDDTIYFTGDNKEVIERFEKLKDLGVIMNQKATFTDQIDHVEKKVRQKIGWICRSFYNRRIQFMKQLCKSLVIPHLQYGSQLWMPVEISEIEKIEKLQRDFFRKVSDLKELNYWKALKTMKMLLLQRRMERYRILYCWKILNGLTPNCGVEEVADSSKTRQGRRLIVPKNKSTAQTEKLRDQSFQFNGPLLFNTLPASIRNLNKCTVDEFKSALDTHLETIPDEPKMDGMNPNASDNKGNVGRYSNSLLFQTRRC